MGKPSECACITKHNVLSSGQNNRNYTNPQKTLLCLLKGSTLEKNQLCVVRYRSACSDRNICLQRKNALKRDNILSHCMHPSPLARFHMYTMVRNHEPFSRAFFASFCQIIENLKSNVTFDWLNRAV